MCWTLKIDFGLKLLLLRICELEDDVRNLEGGGNGGGGGGGGGGGVDEDEVVQGWSF